MTKRLVVLDLDGTLIPYDFVLEFHKLILAHSSSIKCKILAAFFKVLEEFLRRCYILLLRFFIGILKIRVESRYLRLSSHKSYYALLSNFFYACCNKLDIIRCSAVALLNGLRERRKVWEIALALCNRSNSIGILVTGNHLDFLIRKVQRFVNVSYVFRSYAIAHGGLVLAYTIDKNAIARAFNRLDMTETIISDSLYDLVAFSNAARRLLVKGRSLIEVESR